MNLSLVVPTYNRQNYAERQMKFWSGSSVQLYVMDGTDEPVSQEFLDTLKNNIHYYHMPCSIQERIQKSLKLINTKYSAQIGDDEFFIPSTLEKCTKYLDKHKEFIACTGTCLAFNQTYRGIRGRRYQEMMNEGYGCFEDERSERMIKHMNPYLASTLYAVHRTDAWKVAMDVLSGKIFSSPYTHEFQFEMTASYLGKSTVINHLMWLKSTGVRIINTKEHNRSLQFSTWLRHERFKDEVKEFYSYTAKKISKVTGVPKDAVELDLKLAMKAVLQNYLKVNKNHIMLENWYNFGTRMLHISEDSKTKLRGLRIAYQWRPIMEEAQRISDSGVNVDMEQLQKIVEVMKNDR